MTSGGPVLVIGEALIDLVENDDDEPRLAHPGGSPYNVALGLARLGHSVDFVGRLSVDPLGVVLRNHAARSGVDLSRSIVATEPTTVALVELDDSGAATYRFGVDGTADFNWTDAELAGLPDTAWIAHFGSLASWLPPGDAAIERRVSELRRSGAVITYDPNVRPHLQPDAATARAHVERSAALAHIVKTSQEDLAYLYGADRDAAEIAARLQGLGPGLVVVTRGEEGALACSRAGVVSRPPAPVEVVDTVGAGDAFMSGLLDAVIAGGRGAPDSIASLDVPSTTSLIDHASAVAACACARAGANPPRRAELDAWLAVARSLA